MVKAAVLYEPCTSMPVVELTQENPRRGEVRISMGAAGVCASDHHVIMGHTSFPLPMVLGHEGAGVVQDVGIGVSSLKPGDRCILSFVSSCGFCTVCREGRGNLCLTHRATGPRQMDGTLRLKDDGGREIYQFAKLGVFAESVIVPQQACYIIPHDVPVDVAALIGCAVTTGVGCVINQPGLTSGATVAVCGAGGVGLNAIQAAKIVGCVRIIAVDIHAHKLEFARRFGATDTVNAGEVDPSEAIRDMTDGGVDYAFDTFGSAKTTRQMLDAVRQAGTCIVVGLAPEGENTKVDMVDLTRNEKTLRGSYYGSANPQLTFDKIVKLWKKGLLKIEEMIERRYSLEQINEAYDDLASGADGRGVVTFS